MKGVPQVPETVTIIYHEISGDTNQMLEAGAVVSDSIYDTVSSVKSSLIDLGYEVNLLELQPPVSLAEEAIENLEPDIIFNLFEGFDGWPESEAAIVNQIEDLGLCFTGCTSHALRFCENKAAIKELLRTHDIPTPEGQIFHPCRPFQHTLNFPCIVKPLGEHASYGITEKSVVYNQYELRKQVENVWQTIKRSSLVEEFLAGREFRAFIMGNHKLKLFPVEEIVYSLPPEKPRLLTYAAKWIRGDIYFSGTREQCPIVADIELKDQIEYLAIKAYRILKCRNYASIDLRISEDGQVMVIDINPNTDISIDGGARFPLEVDGLDYTSFIAEILNLAKESHQLSLAERIEGAVL